MTTTADPQPVTTTADPQPVTEIPIEALLPGSVAGAELGVVVFSAESFADDARFVTSLEAIGKTLSDVDLAVAIPIGDSQMQFSIGALRIVGFDWSAALEALVAYLQDTAGGVVDVGTVTVDGASLVRTVATRDPSILPTYYHALGDVLVYAHTSDAAVFADALGQMISAEPDTLIEPRSVEHIDFQAFTYVPTPTGGPPVPVSIRVSVIQPEYACVNWTEDFRFLAFVDIPTIAGPFIPHPALAWHVDSHPSLGFALVDSPASPSMSVVNYRADRFERPLVDFDHFSITAQDLVHGAIHFSVPVHTRVVPCLSGLWQDGERVLRLVHQGFEVTADLLEGSLRCADEGRMFTATLEPADGLLVVTGDDLVVCNPQSCVDEGALPAQDLATFSGFVEADGRTVTIEWDGKFYDHDCRFVRVEHHRFAIHLSSIAGPRPGSL